MSSEDWYRNKDWSQETRDAFFKKLERARSQRDQYLVIQALTLSKTHPKITLELVDYFFETRTNSFEDMRALLAKADAYRSMGQHGDAVAAYKSVLEQEERSMFGICPILLLISPFVFD